MDGPEDSKSLTLTGVGRSKENLQKWGINVGKEDTNCACGEAQTMTHLLNCNECLIKCDVTDLQTRTTRP